MGGVSQKKRTVMAQLHYVVVTLIRNMSFEALWLARPDQFWSVRGHHQHHICPRINYNNLFNILEDHSKNDWIKLSLPETVHSYKWVRMLLIGMYA